VNGKLVLATLVAIGVIAATIPLFFDVSAQLPGSMWIESVDMRLAGVNDSHAVLSFSIKLSRNTNAEILTKTYDSTTNLLIGETLIVVEGREGNVTLCLEKDKDYNVLFQLRSKGEIVDRKGFSVRGLSTLIPTEKEIKVELRDVDFQILGVSDTSVIVKVVMYLQSLANYSDIVFHIKAVQFESNVLADEGWISKALEAGKTEIVEHNLSVPKGHNYLIKIEAWRSETLLKAWNKPLNLAPTKVIAESQKEEKVKFQVTDFLRETPAPTLAYSKSTIPGFEVLFALVAIGGVSLWLMRKA